jgi:hypothetical protein
MDTRLRTLERAASTGDPEAKVGLLVHRVRSGVIPRRRLEMAAYLRDKTALEACGVLSVQTSKHTRRWLRGLGKFGEDVAARIMMICHDVLMHGSPNIPNTAGGKRSWGRNRYMNFATMQRIYVAVQDWLKTPDLEHARRVEDAAADFNVWRGNLHRWEQNRVPQHHLLSVVRGTSQVNIEQAFKVTCQFRSPTYSKWGEQQVEMVLKCLIEGDLVPWALRIS